MKGRGTEKVYAILNVKRLPIIVIFPYEHISQHLIEKCGLAINPVIWIGAIRVLFNGMI